MPVFGDRYLAVKCIMMPRDTNPYGTIFGGVVLSHIDMAGAIGAAHAVRARGWAEKPLVTVAMASVEFHKPVFVGDVVSYWTKVKHWGRTSVTMKVTVEADRGGTDEKLTEAEVTYVAVDLSSEPRHTVPIGDDESAQAPRNDLRSNESGKT